MQKTHGMTNTRIYRTWDAMKDRETYLIEQQSRAEERMADIKQLLQQNPGMSIRKIAKALGLSKSGVYRLKKRMLKERDGSDE